MSTRTNIRIQARDANLWLYRHHDGYPAATGSDIAKFLKRAKWSGSRMPDFMNGLMAERYEATSYRPAQAVYEFTDSEHGDIEWYYGINFSRNTGVALINVRERKLRTDGDHWVQHGNMTEKEFRSFVAKEVVEYRKRLKAYNAKRKAA